MVPKSNIKPKKKISLAIVVLIFLFAAIGSNTYLSILYLNVHSSSNENIESFCSINKKIDCVSVAQSKYSAIHGVPVAFLGFEYFGLAAMLVLLSVFGWWKLRAWESVIFWMMILSLPFVIFLAIVCFTIIKSVCILCSVVQITVLALLILLTIVNRKNFKNFVKEGPKDLFKQLSKPLTAMVFVVIIVDGISQFFWVPNILGSTTESKKNIPFTLKGLSVNGVTVGPQNAHIKIEEFSDFECPMCAQGHDVIMEVLKKYPNKIYFRYRYFPLDKSCNRLLTRPFHQNACRAAYFALCAAKQDKFWETSTYLFQHRTALNSTDLEVYAQDLQLDKDKLAKCIKDPQTQQTILQDIEEGIRLKLSGTPILFINNEKIVGLKDLAFWTQKIDGILQKH